MQSDYIIDVIYETLGDFDSPRPGYVLKCNCIWWPEWVATKDGIVMTSYGEIIDNSQCTEKHVVAFFPPRGREN